MNYETIFESEYTKTLWNAPYKVLKTIWTTPESMPEEVYRDVVVKQMDIANELEPENMLVDSKNAYYNMKPETQDWVNEKYVAHNEDAKLQKMAWIVSGDFFAQISFDQFIDDASELRTMSVKYFTSEEEALSWLID